MIKSLKLNAIWNLLCYVLTIVIGVFLTPYIIDHLGQSNYGIWLLLNSLVGYYAFLGFGIDMALRNFIAQYRTQNNYADINEVTSTSLVYFLCLSLIMIVLTVSFSQYLPEIFTIEKIYLNETTTAFIILGISISVNFVSSVFSIINQSYENFSVFNLINAGGLLLRAGSVFFLLRMDMGIKSLAIAILAENILKLLGNIISVKVYYREITLSFKYVKTSSLKKLLNYGVATMVIMLGDILRYNIDNIIIGKYLTTKVVGIYGIAIAISAYVKQLVITIFSILTPRFAFLSKDRDEEVLNSLFNKSLYFSSYLSFGALLLFYFYGKSIVVLWVGDDFSETVPLLILLLLAQSIALAQFPALQLLYAKNKHHLNAKLTIIEGVLNLILSLILVREYGVLGVCLGTVIPMFIMKISFYPIYVSRSLNLKIYNYVKMVILAPICTGLCVGIGIYFEISSYIKENTGVIETLLGLAFIFIIYTIFVFLFSLITHKQVLNDLFLVRVKEKYNL